jgi:hypothetical protein
VIYVGALGHIPHKDFRDAQFLIGEILSREVIVTPTNMIWDRGLSLDQGSEGACVGYGWSDWHNCKPKGYMNQVDDDYAYGWYKRAQELDPWYGTDYEGTTVRAGAKVAFERGLLDTYVWASNFDELDTWLLTQGPLVVASNWYNSMDHLTSDNFTPVKLDSGVRGGHCYLIYGLQDGIYYFQNSWGDDYADGGTFYMTRTGLEKLAYYGQFEAVTAIQLKAA